MFKHASKANVDEAGPGEWINADPIPGCVVCNIGEMWDVGSCAPFVRRDINKIEIDLD